MGSEQLKKAGAAGRGDFARFKPEDLLTVADLGHTLHTPLRSMRYRLEDPQMIELINDIEKQGVLQLITVRLRQANGEWLKETAFGNRRVIACREVNKRRAERNEPPITIGVLMEQRMSDAELRDKYISENEVRKGNDAMTRITTAYDMLNLGVTEEDVLKKFPNFFRNPGELRRAVSPNGILASSPAVQEAVAKEVLILPDAILLCKRFPDHEAQAAVIETYLSAEDDKGRKAALRGETPEDEVEKAPRVTWERMTVIERDKLIALVDGALSSQIMPIKDPAERAQYMSIKHKLEKLPTKKDKAPEPAAS